jgi:hypothetical protein
MEISILRKVIEEMPDLNLAGSAVQPYMFELTKGTEGEKVRCHHTLTGRYGYILIDFSKGSTIFCFIFI